MRKTIEKLKLLKESEDKVEFKAGKGGNISYSGGTNKSPSERRRCILGYVVAFCNEKGGSLVIGMHDKYPHEVVGTSQNKGQIKELESKIYGAIGIRVDIYELFEDDKRVLIIDIPPRPVGKLFKFDDVPLMRVGEELRPMSDEVYLSIIQEQEPDFSAQINENLKIKDLDKEAIQILKNKYAKKQDNRDFVALSDRQVLSDLFLISGGKVTNAALILLGKKEIIMKYLPQAAIMLEYRANESQIHFDKRDSFQEPFFKTIEKLWERINDRNGNIPIRDGAYQSEYIPLFNEGVIREAINNAIAHRDYRRSSETVIKQYPSKMEVISSGGFPLGVTLDNLLTVPSTPRNRLLADVLSKTGLVERSGQGIDRIYLNTLSEGKPMPDYSKSDNFLVFLSLSSQIEDMAFAQFIRNAQDVLSEQNRLSVFDIITLNEIKLGCAKKELDKQVVTKLRNFKLIESRGKTNAMQYILSKEYFELAGNVVEYSKKSDWDESQAFSMVSMFLKKHSKAKMGEFANLFEGHLSRKQTRNFIRKMVEDSLLSAYGEGNGRYYTLSNKYEKGEELFNHILKALMEEMKNKTKGPEKGQN